MMSQTIAQEINWESAGEEIVNAFRNGGSLLGRGGALTPLIKKLLEATLEGEMEAHLSDDTKKIPGNRRNGKSYKTVQTESGRFELETPRDRECSFEPQVVKKRQTLVHPSLEAKVLGLFGAGMSHQDIGSHIKELYDTDISPASISAITDKLLPVINEWRGRPLQKVYPIVFLDAMFFKVKGEDGHYDTRCLYNVLGIDQEGKKEVLGFYMADTEGARFWLGVLSDLKTRGVEDILIACIDGLKGFPEAIQTVYPKTHIQLCVVHQIRHSLKYVCSQDQRAFMADLKKVYQASSKELAEQALLELDTTWGTKYPVVLRSWTDKWEQLSTYFGFTSEVRRLIYTTNPIEGLHRQIRKFTKAKASFSSQNALFKQVYTAIRNIEKKWSSPIQNWAMTIQQLAIAFPGRVHIELNRE
jgi:putative transposase